MPRAESHDESMDLARRYSEMADEQLLELQDDFDDLTETAQECLRSELQSRRLWSAKARGEEQMPLEAGDALEGEEMDGPSTMLLEQAGAPICECESMEQGELIVYALGLEKIRAAVRRPAYGDVRLPEVRVAARDVDRAAAVLEAGIPDSVVQDFAATRMPEDFVEPDCPKCGASDAVLESVDPVNEWMCESCGARWKDAVAEAG